MTKISRAELTISRSLRALAIAQEEARRLAPARPELSLSAAADGPTASVLS
jgi:hypothetical protein